MLRTPVFVKVLLGWYLLYSVAMAISPVDRENWLLANILPALLVGTLVSSYRILPLSNLSYLLITVFMTLHTTGVHYTYAQVPIGIWMEHALDFERNHFDRVVHFCFGFLLTYPIEELFRWVTPVRGWLLYYLTVITPVALSGMWEIIEYAVAEVVHPELGLVYVGSQGDVWDAQKDMAAACLGAVVCVLVLLSIRQWPRRAEVEPHPA